MSSAAERHREQITRLFPALEPIDRFEPLGEGWTSFSYLIDGEWVAQLPRGEHGAASMVKQLDLLPGLAPEVSASIPRPVYASRDPAAMVYPLIEGVSSDLGSVDGMWPERLGRFLYDLHLCPPEFVGMRARTASSVRQERSDELARFRQQVFPLLDADERIRFGERFDAELGEGSRWRFAPCLVHADLGPEHVLVRADGDLSGVIDWEEAAIGDPAWDFAYFVHARRDVGERALAAYGGPPDAGFRDRMRFAFLLMPWHEVIHGLETGQERFVRSGLEGIRRMAEG